MADNFLLINATDFLLIGGTDKLIISTTAEGTPITRELKLFINRRDHNLFLNNKNIELRI